MRLMVFVGAGFFLSILLADAATAAGRLAAEYLRTEYRVNPIGIGETEPRLSWIVTSPKRGELQTAYRVLVASSRERLERDQADLWDSGKVARNETAAVVYAGKPLRARTRCHWKVRVWDKDDRPSDWSAVATWSIGFLKASDWKAEWIGFDKPAISLKQNPPSDPLEKTRWIWYSEGEPARAAPIGERFFRREFKLSSAKNVSSAELIVAFDNRGSAFVNGVPIGEHSGFAAAKRFDVTEQLRSGDNVIAIQAANDGEDPNPAGFLGVLRIEFDKGDPLVFATSASWTAAKTIADGWKTAQDAGTVWSAAVELAPNGEGPWKRVASPSLRLPPPRYLRHAFTLDRPIRRATLFGTALGLYELHLNGERVGRDYLTPGWTDYRKRVYYQAYDVTDQLADGANVLGAVLADGWYAGYFGWQGKRDYFGDRIRLRAQLEIEFEDGTTKRIATAPDWKAATGPLLEADLLMGERYDARLEMPGWDRPDFDDAAWSPVDFTKEIATLVECHPGEPVRGLVPIRPVEITEPAPGRFVVDLGQNFAGVVRLRVRGERGRVIRLRHAERLNPDGSIYTTNLRGARATDAYICAGGEDGRWWQPRFTFHGFQYIEIIGYPTAPSADDVLGIPLTSDTPVVGTFKCSNPMLNKLHSNAYWTQAANFIDLPTDCPQRDERLGWTGDAQIYVRTASHFADVQSFFTKWLVDLDDAQRGDGQFPKVAPLLPEDFLPDGGPAWADAGVICPWNIYEVYGDQRLLARHYDNMARFIAFCEKRSTTEMLPPEKFHCFGDWLNIDDNTPTDVIYTAYFAYSTDLMRQAADALGKDEDAQKYRALWERIKSAFNKAYVGPDGRIKGDTQTAYVLALAFDLVDGAQQEAAAKRLIELIENRDWHLSTGFIGSKDLMLVLSKIGRDDVAYRLLHNQTFPSWGFSIQHGATSIWERWNGWTPQDGFNDPGMNSFAHYSFGAVVQWMVETIGGIKTDGPGFERILIAPKPGDEITWAKVGYRSIRGQMATDWRIEDGQFTLVVTIPANTTAQVRIPTSDAKSVTESGKRAHKSPGVELVHTEPGAAVYGVESGTYTFEARLE